MMDRAEMNMVIEKMQDKEFIDNKLTPMESMQITQEYLKYLENIAPIVKRAIARDKDTHGYLFKI